jgi:hypothetical protein
MREPVTFRPVTTDQEFEEVKEFAATDGHTLTDYSPPFPIVTMWRGKKMFGYFHVINHPIFMPAFNKKLCSPRDFLEASKKITKWFKAISKSCRFPDGTAFMALPPQLTIDEHIVRKLGYEPIQREVWQHVDWEATF